MKIISWNIARRTKKLKEQVKEILSFNPDIIAFQEVQKSSVTELRSLLINFGLKYISDTANLAEGNRSFCVLVASKWDFTEISHQEFSIPFYERILPIIIHSIYGDIEFYAVHIPPGSSNGWKKIETFEGIYKKLAVESKIPRILCGDFNSPQSELSDGRIITWGEKILKNGEAKVTDKGWDDGERCVIEWLAKYDLKDIYRLLNGYEKEEFSWYTNNRGNFKGRRFDHIFASEKLNPISCTYHSALRENKLSDHSPIEAVFNPTTGIL
jgi:exonuclease III